MRARAHTVFLTSWQAECMICLYQSPCFLRGIHHDAAPTLALSTAQTALGLYWYRQGWLKKMYEWRSWWLVSKFANGNLSTRVGSGRNVTYPQSQCLKKGEELADIFYSINTHAFFKVEFNFFFLTDWGPSLAVIKTDRKHFVKNDENNKVFPQKWPAYIWPEVYSLSSGSTTIKTFNFILYIYDFFTPHILQKTFQVWQANNINSPWYRLGTNVFTVLAQCWCKNLHFKSYRSILFMFFSV